MKRTLKITILMVLMTIVTLSLASCNELLNKLPFGNETTPQDVTTPSLLPEQTTPPGVDGTTPQDVTTPSLLPEQTTPPEVDETTPEAHGHTLVIDKAVKPTPTEDGWTEGKHCSTCGEILIPQEKIPAYGELAFTYKVNEDGKTCTLMGIGNYPGDEICIDRYIDGYEVVAIGDNAFFCCETVTSIRIPDSITSIGKRVFSGCTALTDITIPNSITSIGDGAFVGCSSLQSITLGGGLTSIGLEVFFGCDTLDDIYVTNLEAWLNISFILPDGYELWESEAHGTHHPNCYGELHFLDESGNEMTSIVIPESVTSIREMAFAGCKSLTSVTIGNHVTSIGKSAFSGCDSLNNVQIPNSVTVIDHSAFYRCSSFTSIVIPDSVTSIGWRAFAFCDSVTSVAIGKGVTVIQSDAFRDCSNIEDVYIKDIEAWVNISFGGLYHAHPNWYGTLHILDENGEEVTEVAIPEGVTSISDHLFYNCKALTGVVIPDSVIHIGESAFSRCSSLKSIIIGNGIKSVGESAFYGCDDAIYTEYKSVKYVGDVQNPYAILIGAIDRKLSTYEIHPDTKIIAARAFAVCNNMTSIIIPEGVMGIGEFAFLECYSLTSIVIPASVERIVRYAFSHCTALKNITFENPNSWAGRIGEPNVNGNVYYYVEFAADELSNSKTAAQYLTSDYKQYLWDRTE